MWSGIVDLTQQGPGFPGDQVMICADGPFGIESKQTQRLSPFGPRRRKITIPVEEIAPNR